MDDVRANWTDAERKGSDLEVPIEGDTDEHWGASFIAQEQILGSETRGQTWDHVTWAGSVLIVVGIRPDPDEGALRDYVDALLTNSNAESQRTR